jgi:hypothetical protein
MGLRVCRVMRSWWQGFVSLPVLLMLQRMMECGMGDEIQHGV